MSDKTWQDHWDDMMARWAEQDRRRKAFVEKAQRAKDVSYPDLPTQRVAPSVSPTPGVVPPPVLRVVNPDGTLRTPKRGI